MILSDQAAQILKPACEKRAPAPYNDVSRGTWPLRRGAHIGKKMGMHARDILILVPHRGSVRIKKSCPVQPVVATDGDGKA